MHQYFHLDGSQSADPDDQVWGGHESCYCTVTSSLEDGKIRQYYMRINLWSHLCISRRQDWSWEMKNYLRSYSSILDADKPRGPLPGQVNILHHLLCGLRDISSRSFWDVLRMKNSRLWQSGKPGWAMEAGPTPTKPRKVMVVADPTRESSAAVQYTLSHGVVDRDELILLQVVNAGSWKSTLSTLFRRSSLNATLTGGGGDRGGAGLFQGSNGRGIGNRSIGGGGGGMETDYLEEMKRACENAQPKVRVRVERVEMDQNGCKASVILSQCTLHGVDVLVIGQRRNFSQAILGYRRPGSSSRGTRSSDTAEYLIENCKCTCVAVQRKGQNAGYLLNTKTCRNFWLLA
ncbi:hypothetical protein MLD38_039527 [Melastoma candidum]|uniref:Uncharacterized protein n=1 Tax=Melastoma candidum TaxID=119954 RepID=A0ACB9L3U9_9MYRT|nr:hypothetical protein MLD38_039527 [Melastoma candidum]